MKLAILGAAVLALAQTCVGVSLDLKTGVTCSMIDGSKKSPGTIIVKIDDLATAGKTSAHDTKVPFLIFRYSEILNLGHVPSFEDYKKRYARSKDSKTKLYAGLIDTNKSEFDLSAYKDLEVEESNVFTGFLQFEEGTYSRFLVKSKGFYCVYIAPPLEISSLVVPVSYVNSHGYLSFQEYVEYNQQKSLVLVGIALFAYLFYTIVGFKSVRAGTAFDFQGLDSISIISKAVLFYVLAPYVLLAVINVILGFIENEISVSGTFLRKISLWLTMSYESVVSYLTLIFAMGFGIVYYYEAGSRNYRVFKQEKARLSLGLLVANMVVGTLAVGFPSNDTKIVKDTGVYLGAFMTNSKEHYKPYMLVVYCLSGVIPLLWYGLPIYNYFQTKKIIKKLPLSGVNGSQVSSFSIEKILTLFRRSLLAIYVLPILVTCVMGLLLGALTVRQILDSTDDSQFYDNADRPNLRASAISVITLESTLTWGVVFLGSWSKSAPFLAKVISLFYIWLNYDNGFIVDNGLDDIPARLEVDEA